MVKVVGLFGGEAVRIVEALKDIGGHKKNLSLTLNLISRAEVN